MASAGANERLIRLPKTGPLMAQEPNAANKLTGPRVPRL